MVIGQIIQYDKYGAVRRITNVIKEDDKFYYGANGSKWPKSNHELATHDDLILAKTQLADKSEFWKKNERRKQRIIVNILCSIKHSYKIYKIEGEIVKVCSRCGKIKRKDAT